jgi:hypothetical protein
MLRCYLAPSTEPLDQPSKHSLDFYDFLLQLIPLILFEEGKVAGQKQIILKFGG